MIIATTKTFYAVQCDKCGRITPWYAGTEVEAIDNAQLFHKFAQLSDWPEGIMLCPECVEKESKAGKLYPNDIVPYAERKGE